MKFVLLAFFIFSNYSLASTCEYSTNKTEISWTAFKTPKKVGVNGKFDKHTVDAKKSKSVLDLIKTASFSIDTTSVNTGNPARDKTIAEYFFKSTSRPLKISGKVIDANMEITKVLFIINGKEREILLNNDIQDSKLILTGNIDVLELGLGENLSAIHKACEKLHEGKT
jgi:hypothetical protein